MDPAVGPAVGPVDLTVGPAVGPVDLTVGPAVGPVDPVKPVVPVRQVLGKVIRLNSYTARG